jgi:hypothetical protein
MVARVHCIAAICCVALISGAHETAFAADMPPAPVYKAPPPVVVNPWTFDITPYAWLPSLNGSSTIKGHTTDIDATFFGDLIHRKIPKELFGLMAAFEARNDRFAVIGDFTYMLLGAGKGGARSETFGQRVRADIDLDVNLTTKMVIFELAGAYQLARWGATSGMPGSGTAIDIYGGGRLWWQQADVSLALSAQLIAILPRRTFTISADRAVATSGDITWIDPIVGLRLRHQFAPGSELTLSGDVGGFGVGSEFSWQAIGAYRFTFAKTNNVTWSGMLGYRALYVDYSKSAGDTLYVFDMLQHGPVAGLTARF